MKKFRLIFNECERLRKEDKSLFESFEDFDENIAILIENMNIVDPEDEVILCGTNSTY